MVGVFSLLVLFAHASESGCLRLAKPRSSFAPSLVTPTMRLCALLLLFLCCYADYTKQSYWPNMQCLGIPSQENFLNVGLGGCVSSGDHSTRSICTNMSYGESRSYSSNDCTGIYSRTLIVFDPACLSDGNYYGLSTLSACVSTDEKNVAPSSAAPNTILYKSYLVDRCSLISPQTLVCFSCAVYELLHPEKYPNLRRLHLQLLWRVRGYIWTWLHRVTYIDL
jgi:hypothetical protein